MHAGSWLGFRPVGTPWKRFEGKTGRRDTGSRTRNPPMNAVLIEAVAMSTVLTGSAAIPRRQRVSGARPLPSASNARPARPSLQNPLSRGRPGRPPTRRGGAQDLEFSRAAGWPRSRVSPITRSGANLAAEQSAGHLGHFTALLVQAARVREGVPITGDLLRMPSSSQGRSYPGGTSAAPRGWVLELVVEVRFGHV
jgi:hypothetical protein